MRYPAPDRKILPESICPTFELLDFIIFRIRFGFGFSDMESYLPLYATFKKVAKLLLASILPPRMHL